MKIDQSTFARLQICLAQVAKQLAKDDPEVGTCDICGDNLGYVMSADNLFNEDGSPFSPCIDKKTKKPMPSMGNNPWPIIVDEESVCCTECAVTEVLPARIAMSHKERLH